VVDAPSPEASFREAIRQSIMFALEEGLETEADIDDLVTQICYRVSDLDELLQLRGHQLSQYSNHFRKDKNVDYSDDHFDIQPLED
jgi:hypothetical protein